MKYRLILMVLLLLALVTRQQEDQAGTAAGPTPQNTTQETTQQSDPAKASSEDPAQPATANDCSANPCEPTDFHFCNSTMSICAKQITDRLGGFSVTQAPSYFYFQPEFEAYSIMMLVLCGQSLPGTTNIMYAKIQQQEDELPSAANARSIVFPTTGTCIEYPTSNVYFGLDSTNTTYKKLLLSLALSKPGTEAMSIAIAGRQVNHSVLSTIVTSSVIVLSVALLFTMLYYIRRRCYIRRPPERKQSIRHIDKYMPIKKLKDCSTTTETINCPVCLADINREDDVRKTPCQHIFHPQCLSDWCKQVMNCPNCRLDFSKQSLKNMKKPVSASQQMTPRRWWSRDLRTHLVEQASSP